ncbi:Uncharacterised protein [Klebsiella pneumoniae]|nr:Uncharacterised protein [Klebsiella pneumoniae]VTN20375.1 Uncharacterised protein [Klebsiella pneumoniae]
MNLDKSLPALVMKNVEDNMGLLPNISSKQKITLLYLLLEKQGLVNPVWLNLSFRMLSTRLLNNLKNVITFRKCSQVLM